MLSIAQIGFGLQGKKQRLSHRTSVVKELYDLYTSQPQLLYEENRKRFYYWVKNNHPEALKDTRNKSLFATLRWHFERAKLPPAQKYFDFMSPRYFAIKLSHCDLDTLYYMLSIAKDKRWRGENIAQYLLGSIKVKPEQPTLNLVSHQAY